MLEPESQCRFRDAVRFVVFNQLRRTAGDRTEAARPGANIAEDHEGRRPPGVTFGPVRTACVLANRFQAKFAQQPVRVEISIAARQCPFQPRWQAALGRRKLPRSDSGLSITGSDRIGGGPPAQRGMIGEQRLAIEPEACREVLEEALADQGRPHQAAPFPASEVIWPWVSEPLKRMRRNGSRSGAMLRYNP